MNNYLVLIHFPLAPGSDIGTKRQIAGNGVTVEHVVHNWSEQTGIDEGSILIMKSILIPADGSTVSVD